MEKLHPKDVVAIVALVGIFLLKMTGHNGGLDIAGSLILGYYFGHRQSKVDPGA